MVIDFINLNQKEQPVLVLRNLDGTAIQTLGFAFNISGEFCYNEISTLKFDVPAFANGIATPHYDDIIGTRVVDLVGWGQFILIDPEIKKDGITEIKSCKAYSLEYELTYKKITLPEGGYYLNYVNPSVNQESLMDIVKSYAPSWSVEVDQDLHESYRVFSEDRVNVYDFLKNTVQQKYNCIVDFDTYNRKIIIHDAAKDVATKEVFLSTGNLAKELTIIEDTENIFTCLDVNGAEGVTISRVNPMGGNKIYNLDYYMNETHFSASMIEKWNQWKNAFADNQEPYFNLAIRRLMKTSQIVLEKARLTEMENELKSEKNNETVALAALAMMTDKNSQTYKDQQTTLNNAREKIKVLEGNSVGSIKYQDETIIGGLETEKDALTEAMEAINAECSFEEYFEPEDILILDRYIKEDAIEDSSFVLSQVNTFDSLIVSTNLSDELSWTVSGGEVTMSVEGNDSYYSIVGGTINSIKMNANIVRMTIEKKSDGKFVLSGYLSKGSVDDQSFDSGTVTIDGTYKNFSENKSDDNIISLSFDSTNGRLYFTKDKSEYEEFAICWDLYEYGVDCLNKLAYPAFTFKVSAVNFLTLDEFRRFATQLELGKKIYVEKAEADVLQPILIKVKLEYDDPSSLQLEFSDTYSASDSKFTLVDLLDKSISLGKTVDANKYAYNSFVKSGAPTEIQRIIDSALDVAKNNILSSVGQAISWDDTGMHFRKWNDDRSDYMPQEIAVINNNIVFTDDGWNTAKMAIGCLSDVTDANGNPMWGIAAPNLIGKMILGENLSIQTNNNTDGTPLTFKVDSSGASLYNADFMISNDTREIVLHPDLGFGIGTKSIITETKDLYGKVTERKWNTDNANFWVDTSGNVHFKGNLEGATGSFTGTVSSGDDENYVAMNGTNLGEGKDYSDYAFWAGNEDPESSKFWVKKDGSMQALSGTFKGIIQANDFQIVDSTGLAKSILTTDKLIDQNYLSLYGLEIKELDDDGEETGKTTFKISNDGSITLNGSINFGDSYSDVKSLYNITLASTPSKQYSKYEDDYDEDKNDGWHKDYDEDNDLYVSYSYDGGYSWTAAQMMMPKYIQNTYISSTEIKSPNITGTDISVLDGYFKVKRTVGNSTAQCGSMGYATGMTTENNKLKTTYGVAITSGDTMDIDYDTTNTNYVIVTDSGVRIQGASGSYLYIDSRGCYYKHSNEDSEKKIGSGVCVFG